MSKITDKDLNAMTLADLQDLSKRIKIAEKAHRQNANKAVASTLVPGDQVEFTVPKTNEVQTGTVLKVKRVMIALKALDNSPWNVPLTSIGKKIADAPAAKTKAVKKASKTVAKAKPGVAKASKTKASKTTSKAKASKTKTSKTPAVTKKAEKSSSDVIKAIREKIAAKKTESVKKTASVAPTQEEATAE